jgi:hypothetical protein
MDVLVAIEMQFTGHGACFQTMNRSNFNKFAIEHAAIWLHAGPILDSLTQRHKVMVWIDHSSKEWRWHINESAILSPFIHFANRADVEISIHLPKHANNDIPMPPFHTRREPRQENFGQRIGGGQLIVARIKQFPLFSGLHEHESEWDAIEARERGMWKPR